MKPSIRKQAVADIKAAKKLAMPGWMILSLAVLCIPVFVVFDQHGALNMAVPVLNSAAVFGLLIHLKWTLRWQPLFWTTITVFAAVHILLIWHIPWTSNWVPAVAVASISSVDFCAMLWALAAVEVLLARKSASER